MKTLEEDMIRRGRAIKQLESEEVPVRRVSFARKIRNAQCFDVFVDYRVHFRCDV